MSIDRCVCLYGRNQWATSIVGSTRPKTRMLMIVTGPISFKPRPAGYIPSDLFREGWRLSMIAHILTIKRRAKSQPLIQKVFRFVDNHFQNLPAREAQRRSTDLVLSRKHYRAPTEVPNTPPLSCRRPHPSHHVGTGTAETATIVDGSCPSALAASTPEGFGLFPIDTSNEHVVVAIAIVDQDLLSTIPESCPTTQLCLSCHAVLFEGSRR